MKSIAHLTMTFSSASALVVWAGLSTGCASPLPCPAHVHPSGETSETPRVASSIGATAPAPVTKPIVIAHGDLRTFENNGNALVGIATKSLGSEHFEVWRSSVAPGSATPPHQHSTEEVFIFLSGRGRATVGDDSIEFEAPATVIAPAGVMHQFFNTGETATDAIVIVGVGSHIHNKEGQEMILPWRN